MATLFQRTSVAIIKVIVDERQNRGVKNILITTVTDRIDVFVDF
jgi:hypothetical protein